MSLPNQHLKVETRGMLNIMTDRPNRNFQRLFVERHETHPPVPEHLQCPKCRFLVDTGEAVDWLRDNRPDITGNAPTCSIMGCGRPPEPMADGRSRNESMLLPGVPDTGANLDAWSDREYLDPAQTASVREAREATQSWIAGDGPPQLILIGFTGNGKSYLAEIAAKAVLKRGDRIIYRTEESLSADIHRAITDHTVDDVVDAFSSVPYLVIDDFLTVGTKSEFYQGKRDAIFNSRWAKAGLSVQKPCRTLVTCNVKFGEWPRRIASRMGDIAKSKAVVINAPDWRTTGK
jgi:hypothetical protein